MKKQKKTAKKPASRLSGIWNYVKTHRWSRWLGIGLVSLLGLFILWIGSIYAFFIYYQQKHKAEPITFGVTYIADYARYLDLDPKQTMLALRDELGFKRFRLVSYWKNIEPKQNTYNFSELDWQIKQVAKVNGEVTLSIGLRQPRWPECQFPDWVNQDNKKQWYPQLNSYITQVVNRYKNNKTVTSYQLENEFFLNVFGKCNDYNRQRLIDEFNLVKKLDPNKPIILSLANNYFGVPTGKPRADQYGVSVYKRVFDYTITHRYFEYPFPAWYYGGRAGMTEFLTGKDSMLHELQAEPWPPVAIKDASIEEQNKSMDADRLAERIEYAKGTGFKDIDLWGAEWWYWRKVKFDDPSLWDTIKNADLN